MRRVILAFARHRGCSSCGAAFARSRRLPEPRPRRGRRATSSPRSRPATPPAIEAALRRHDAQGAVARRASSRRRDLRRASAARSSAATNRARSARTQLHGRRLSVHVRQGAADPAPRVERPARARRLLLSAGAGAARRCRRTCARSRRRPARAAGRCRASICCRRRREPHAGRRADPGLGPERPRRDDRAEQAAARPRDRTRRARHREPALRQAHVRAPRAFCRASCRTGRSTTRSSTTRSRRSSWSPRVATSGRC